ncbi:MAG: hypothetical protein L6R42_004259 [Xanthoria sp. 1 TBL-2021]|nr:MAG: hypothetical protein L6R42_004259 [Xanthoria sp. 1 TBL-2021]
MRASDLQTPSATLSSGTKRRQNVYESDSASQKQLKLSDAFNIEDIIGEDRIHYKKIHKRTSYIGLKTSAPSFTAIRVDANGEPTGQQIEVNSRKYGDKNHCLVAEIDGEPRIVTKHRINDGKYNLHLWLGHKMNKKPDCTDGEVIGCWNVKSNGFDTEIQNGDKSSQLEYFSSLNFTHSSLVVESTKPQTALIQQMEMNEQADDSYYTTRPAATSLARDVFDESNVEATQQNHHDKTDGDYNPRRRRNLEPRNIVGTIQAGSSFQAEQMKSTGEMTSSISRNKTQPANRSSAIE